MGMEKSDLKERTKSFALKVIKDDLISLLDEADQILAITVSSIKTARKGKK